jgi:hypothetical protein
MKYIKIAIVVLMLVTCCTFVAEAGLPWWCRPQPTEKIIVPFVAQDCDSQLVATYQCCAIKFKIPCMVSSITNIRGIFSQIWNQCSNGGSIVSGFSKTLTTDTSKWTTVYSSNTVGSSILLNNIKFNCRPGQTWYYIWYTTGCSYMQIKYGMNNTAHYFDSYIYTDSSFVKQPNNFLLEIKGMSL